MDWDTDAILREAKDIGFHAAQEALRRMHEATSNSPQPVKQFAIAVAIGVIQARCEKILNIGPESAAAVFRDVAEQVRTQEAKNDARVA